jgi:hypothetical protein
MTGLTGAIGGTGGTGGVGGVGGVGGTADVKRDDDCGCVPLFKASSRVAASSAVILPLANISNINFLSSFIFMLLFRQGVRAAQRPLLTIILLIV